MVGLFRTTDGGANWTQLKGNGLPEGDWGRVGVTVSRRMDGGCMRLIEAGKKSGLYRSDDGGNTLGAGERRLAPDQSRMVFQPADDRSE